MKKIVSTRMEVRRPVVWVVGASRGIGREIASEFAAAGCVVALSARSKKHLASAVQGIAGRGGRALAVPCDLRIPPSIGGAYRTIRKKLGNVDLLVNNGGITSFRFFADTTRAESDAVIHTNLMGPIECIRTVLSSMIERQSGWIITIISVAAVKTFKGSAAYSASKAGILAFTRSLREEVRRHGIKVVNIIPGATMTEMWRPEHLEKFGSRMMSPRGVAQAVLSAYRMPPDVVPEELLIRPVQGDIE